jgi:hypothetical protein
MFKLGCILPLSRLLPQIFPIYPLPSPQTLWEEAGHEGEIGLLSLHGSYYLADLAPTAVKKSCSSQTGGWAGYSEGKYTQHWFLKGKNVKNESSIERKTTHN